MNIFAYIPCVVFVFGINTFTYAAPLLTNIQLDIFNVVKEKARNLNGRSFDFPFIESPWKFGIKPKKKLSYAINIFDRDSHGDIHSYSYSLYRNTKEDKRRSWTNDELDDKRRRRHGNKRLKRLHSRRQEDETHPSSDENSRSFRSKKSSSLEYDEHILRGETKGQKKETRNTRRLLMQSRTMRDYETAGDDDVLSAEDDYPEDDYPEEDDNFSKGVNSQKIDWKKYLKEDGPSVMELLAVNSRHKSGKAKPLLEEYHYRK